VALVDIPVTADQALVGLLDGYLPQGLVVAAAAAVFLTAAITFMELAAAVVALVFWVQGPMARQGVLQPAQAAEAALAARQVVLMELALAVFTVAVALATPILQVLAQMVLVALFVLFGPQLDQLLVRSLQQTPAICNFSEYAHVCAGSFCYCC
jgi:hypothetical protein